MTSNTLPVALCRNEFIQAFNDHDVVVLTGETGAGKTTQIPQYVLEQILKEDPECKLQIACTQPRRLAATSIAERVANERNVALGEEVGYKIRFDQKCGKKTRLVYMTDGFLNAEMLQDPTLSKYRCIIIDEAHERSVSTDIVMAKLRRLVLDRARVGFKIIIMSATLDATNFQAYFDDAPLFHIIGRLYPVKIYYLDPEERGNSSLTHIIVQAVNHIHNYMPPGDILIFAPGEGEIQSVCGKIAKSNDESLRTIPLYSSLPKQQQNQAFKDAPVGIRKCIVATNIAETSLTIDGIVYVIDSGLVKQALWNPRIRMNSLLSVPISKASANQRAGRAGRTRPGVCFRLYTKKTFDEFRALSKPGIQLTDFTPILLNMIATPNWKDFSHFHLITMPDKDCILQAIQDLIDLKCMDDNGKATQTGRVAASFPIDPQWACAIEAAKEYQVPQSMIMLAAIASVEGSIFRESYDHRLVLPKVHQQWADPHSDHIMQLNIFNAYLWAKKENEAAIEAWCDIHMLSAHTMEHANKIRIQLLHKYRDLKDPDWLEEPTWTIDTNLRLRKALALGLFSNTALRLKKRHETYRTIHYHQAALTCPTSTIEEDLYDWVVFNSVHRGRNSYMITITGIKPDWIKYLDFFQQGRMPKGFGGHVRQLDVKQLLESFRSVGNPASNTVIIQSMSGQPAPRVTLPLVDPQDDSEEGGWEFRKIPSSWIPDGEDIKTAVENMLAAYKNFDTMYTGKDIKPRFRLRSDTEGVRGFHAIMRPTYHSKNKTALELELVHLTKKTASGQKVFYSVPLAEINQKQYEGWELWHPRDSILSSQGKDQRICPFPEDTMEIDKPHVDTKWYFDSRTIEAAKKIGPEVIDVEDENNISTSKEFRP